MQIQRIEPSDEREELSGGRASCPSELGELRYRTLLGRCAWQALAPDVRRRFSKRLAAGESTVYSGHIEETVMSRAGWLLAQLCRLIGAPLPLENGGQGKPAVVSVTEDRQGGQFWTRHYGRDRGFPQIVHSAKRFSGPTGLEEYIGFGIGIALDIRERGGALIFVSRSYFFRLFGWRIGLSAFLSPGRLEVGHHDRGCGTFAFTLDLVHPVLGDLIRQTVIFRDTKETRP